MPKTTSSAATLNGQPPSSATKHTSGASESMPLLPATGRHTRLPQTMLAALLIIGGALGGLLLFNRYDQRTGVLVMAADVPAGTLIERDHLVLSAAALAPDMQAFDSLDDAVGRYASHDLAVGELVSITDISDSQQVVAAGESVIGLLLEPGAYPTRLLATGDRVDVFAPGDGRRGLLAEDLRIHGVVESSSDGRTLLISVVAEDSSQAGRILDAVDDGGVRLALRGRE